MYHVSVFGALSKHCEVRLVAPLPWWTRANKPQDWLAAPQETSTGIDATFPTWWSVPKYGVAYNGRAMYHSVRGVVGKLRKEFPFDAILASWAYPDAYAASLLAKEFGVPLVINVLGSDINALAKMPELRPQILEAIARSHRVISVSHALGKAVEELGVSPDKIVVQHNGVDGAKFKLQDRGEVRRRLGLPADRKIIVYAGNWVPEKGVDVLAEAMGILKKSGQDDLSLALIGSGPLEMKLKEIVSQYGLQNEVLFCGRKNHTEIPDWMAAADIFCLPSLREGCPNVILESLSCGRPVVASGVGGVPELLDERNGLMVPANDPKALSSALLTALDRPWSAEALRETVRNRSWDTVGQGYFSVIESAVAAGAK